MRVRFNETMAGTVKTPEGERKFSFSARASSDTVKAMTGWAPLALDGTASLGGVAEDTPLLPGSQLEIGLPLHRYLRYQVHFRSPDGNEYRFFGEKTVRLRRAAKTMTTLPGTLFKDGVEWGTGTLRFAFTDLPRFLASFRVARRRRVTAGL